MAHYDNRKIGVPERYQPDTLVRIRDSSPAPDLGWCDGCKQRGLELTLFENEKYYCVGCANRVAAMLNVRPMSERSS